MVSLLLEMTEFENGFIAVVVGTVICAVGHVFFAEDTTLRSNPSARPSPFLSSVSMIASSGTLTAGLVLTTAGVFRMIRA